MGQSQIKKNSQAIATKILIGAMAFFIGIYFYQKFNPRSPAGSCATLDEKLDTNFNRYESTKQQLIQDITQLGKVVSRDELDDKLKPDAPCRLTSNDYEELNKNFNNAISVAKKAAEDKSIINIDNIRTKKNILAFCNELPKGALLHIHPNGTLDRATLRQLKGGSKNKKMSGEDSYFLPDRPVSFSEFESIFGPMQSLLGIGLTENLKIVLENFVVRAAAKGVLYVELSKYMDVDASTEATLDSWSNDFYQKSGVIVRWNLGFLRTHSPSMLSGKLKGIVEQEYRQRKSNGVGYKNIVGIDLYAAEENNDALEKGQSMYVPLHAMELKQHPKNWQTVLKRTMHAGEFGNRFNVRDAVLMGANRVGHGVLLESDPLTLEYARRMKLPIEINLVSNYRLSSIKNIKDHPFLKYLRLGLPVSLSTDDEGMFETDIASECEMAIKNFDIQYAELKQMSYNSIANAFADSATKKNLQTKLDSMFLTFESKWQDRP